MELEGELAVPPNARAAAVVTHPHPLHGGDLHSSVVAALFDAFPEADIAALRLNFRGVGRSTGGFEGGQGERQDVVAALDTLAAEVPGVPLVVTGWSFGADVAAAVDDDRIAGWFLVAPPLAAVVVARAGAGKDKRPTLLAVPEHDQFRGPEKARELVAGWRGTNIEIVPSADHFLFGATTRVAARAVEFVESLPGVKPRP